MTSFSKSPRTLALLGPLLLWGSNLHAEMAPEGYTGAIDTPTAEVLPLGSMNLSYTNNVPEWTRQYPGVGYFGSTNLGFGPLPGLEIVGRLVNDGSTTCDQFLPNCPSRSRDLSAGAKYELPLLLPLDTHLAVGGSDLAGAAKNFTQQYAVLTSYGLKGFDLSLGASRGVSPAALMNGIFGSAIYHINDYFKVAMERDTREYRVGGSFVYGIANGLDLELGLSRKITNNTPTQLNQTNIGLTYLFGGKVEPPPGPTFLLPGGNSEEDLPGVPPQSQPALEAPEVPPPNAAPARPDNTGTTRPARTLLQSSGDEPGHLAASSGPGGKTAPIVNTTPNTGPAPSADSVPIAHTVPAAPAPSDEDNADRIASALAKHGFGHINVGRIENQGWWIKAESVGWRKNQLDGIGVAIGVLLKQNLNPEDTVVITLTYMQKETLTAKSTLECLSRFVLGDDYCNGEQTIELSNGKNTQDPAPAHWLVSDGESTRFHPQFEFKPAFNYVVGNEYGLYNYSVGLSSGWEMELAKGLLWSGAYLTPLSNSSGYTSSGVFYNSRITNRFASNYLSYTQELLERTWVEVSAGYENQPTVGMQTETDLGSQVELDWLSANGRTRLQSLVGDYHSNIPNVSHTPAYVSGRYSILPGLWSLDLTGGKFYNGDRGAELASNHWFGDYRVQFYYRKSGNTPVMPTAQFIGFDVSFPLGPKQSYQMGPITLRGGDHTALGLQTTYHNGGNNNITSGYGVEPTHDHGLYRDILDFDRAGVEDLWANIGRVREAIKYVQEQD